MPIIRPSRIIEQNLFKPEKKLKYNKSLDAIETDNNKCYLRKRRKRNINRRNVL